MRKITEMGNGKDRLAIVYRNSEWDEYVVKFYLTDANGSRTHQKDADYHTDDLQDAKTTGMIWCKG